MSIRALKLDLERIWSLFFPFDASGLYFVLFDEVSIGFTFRSFSFGALGFRLKCFLIVLFEDLLWFWIKRYFYIYRRLQGDLFYRSSNSILWMLLGHFSVAIFLYTVCFCECNASNSRKKFWCVMIKDWFTI